jgi:tetratricopeptide (TPR) repeat protein
MDAAPHSRRDPFLEAMTLVNLTPLRRLALAAGLAFLVAIAALSLGGSDVPSSPAPAGGGIGSVRPTSSGTLAEIRRLQGVVRRAPAAPTPRVALAGEYLQRVRETGDPAFYGRAETLLRGVLARDPHNADALVALGGLALSRHDFRGGLRLARRSRAGLAALPVTVDALVELGRYDAAERALQRLADLKPNLSSYSRVSYLRELRGDLGGAASALALAAAAGGPAPENVAAIEVLRGDLALVRGRRADARRAYAAALALVPGYAAAEAGRARLAAAGGDLRGAIARWQRLVARLPLPEYAIGLGEAELAAGRPRAARRDLELVHVEQALLARAGVNTDAELALFEADHGDRARGVRLARRAWAAAPSVRSADALGWALTRAGHAGDGFEWARRARRLGSADPMFAYHAGIAARAAGHDRVARRLLRFALAHGLATRPWHAQAARRALGGVR